MIVEIKGVHFDNQGAHMMLLATRERLQGWWPDARLVLGRGPTVPEQRRAEVGALRRLRLRRRRLDLTGFSYLWPQGVHDWLARREVAAEGGLDAILDVSGFAYGRDWDPWLMAYAADEVLRLARHGRPFVFLPQAYGPFDDTPTARAFAKALARASLVCARDDLSTEHLVRLNPALRGRIERYPDFTIELAADPACAKAHGIDRDTVLLVPNHHMVGGRNADPAWREGYVAFLGELAVRLRGSRRVALLNHEGAADSALCVELSRRVPGLQVIAESDPRATKGALSAAGAVVSSRYHACVSALSQGVPCLGTAWSHKYQALYEEFAVPEDLQRECDSSAAAARVLRMMDERSVREADLLRRTAALQARVDAMWQRVFAIMQQIPRRRPPCPNR